MDKEKISKWFLMGIIVFIIFSLLYRYIILLPKFQERGRYTIGLFNRYSSKKGGAYDVFFSYSVKGKNFKERSGASSKDFNDYDIGKRFLVKYVEGEETLSSLLLEYPVPDSIKSAPPEGWKELPTWAKQKR